MIEGENPRTVLSDDAIVDMLPGQGIDIARRTVAKYREQLGIPSSVQRRREKNFQADLSASLSPRLPAQVAGCAHCDAFFAFQA